MYGIIYIETLKTARKGCGWKEDNMRILIGADLVPTAQNEHLFVKGDAKELFGDVLKLREGADRFIVNLECALTDSTHAIKKFGPNLKATPAAVNGLRAIGVTDVLLSNNHTLDFGVEGMRDTMKTLENAGIPYTGVGENDTDSRKPYFIEADGKRIGIINVCEHEYTYAIPNRMGANPFDPFLTMQDIRKAKEQCDFLIAIYHGGKEYCKYPSPRVYNLTREMVYCGADVVITQHSHCIGCYEQFEGAHIVHGQGNFNFVYSDAPNQEEGWFTSLLIELEIDKDIDIKFYPLVATENGCDVAKGEKAKEIMGSFLKRCKELSDGKWIDGWREFCHAPAREYYHERILGKNETEMEIQNFAHYLDCEAHTDVWRELYPTWNMTNDVE